MLCSFLAARAFFETFAVMWDYDQAIARAIQRPDLRAIETLTRKRMFATRSKETLSTYPELAATSVLTFIDKLPEQFPTSTFRKAYDQMSERCHPNSAGTISMFADIDSDTGTVSYSDRQNVEWAFRLLFSIVKLITVAELVFDRLDEAIVGVETLEHDSSNLNQDKA